MMGFRGTMGWGGMMGISLTNPNAVVDCIISQALTGGVDVTDVTMMEVAPDPFAYAGQALAASPLASVTDPAEFIALLYQDMMGRTASAADISYWSNFLDGSAGGRAAMITYMASSAEASHHVGRMGWMSDWLIGTPAVTGIATRDMTRTMETLMCHAVFGGVNGSALTMMDNAANALDFAASALAASPLAPVTDPGLFIDLMYQTLLARAAGTSETAYWENFLSTHANDRAAALMYMSASPEAQARAATLGWVSPPSSATGSADGVALTSPDILAESLIAHALNGIVRPGDLAMMGTYASPAAYAQAALQASSYAAVTDPATFVTDMYHAMLGRDPGTAELSYWDGIIANNGGNRAMALVGIANAPEALIHADISGWV